MKSDKKNQLKQIDEMKISEFVDEYLKKQEEKKMEKRQYT